MTTWISRTLSAVCLLSLLGGCEDGAGGLQGLAGAAPAAKGLTQTRMADGDVTLTAPPGFCIDKSSLRPRFALVARCDALGAEQAADVPLGVMTISLLPAGADGILPTPQDTAAAARLVRVADPVTRDGAVIFQADGPVPIEGMSPRHWRGTALIGGHIFAVAFYGPDAGRAVSDEGRGIVTALIRLSSAAT